MTEPWLCAQQGAREHYAVPRALASTGRLMRLVTDVWAGRRSWLARLGPGVMKRLAGRRHSDVPESAVRAFNRHFLLSDLMQRVRRRPEPAFYQARNDAFDQYATAELTRLLRAGSPPAVVFSYAHSSRRLFRVAKAEGCRTVLGQFDPGPVEADIVDAEAAAHPEYRHDWVRYPAEYVRGWREEVEASDVVMVNSEWSAECLTRVGVEPHRVRVVPLAYPVVRHAATERVYPVAFTRDRPLVVLFLGQVILRKGVARLVEAARLIRNEPVEFRLVGPTDIRNLDDLTRGLPIRVYGSVSRDDVHRHYAEADVFLLPTLSDGFALTQLEAFAWRLPVIASTRCGRVVDHERNGLVLSEPTAEAIAGAVSRLLASPALLAELSAGTSVDGYGLDRLATELAALAPRAAA